MTAPRSYPGQFIYPSLDKVNTSDYRQFRSASYGADAIKFDTRHTLYPSGAEIAVKFLLTNPTGAAWRQVSVKVHWIGP